MTADLCSNGFCRDIQLLSPPPIPPEEYLPRAECYKILSGCNVLSSQKGAFSNYSDPCVPVKISTAAVTVADITTQSTKKESNKPVTHKYPQPTTTEVVSESTSPRLILNVTKSTQSESVSLFNAAIPAWLISVIVFAVLAVIIIIVVIVICIVKKVKGGERCLASVRKVFTVQFLSEKRSKISKWISSHSKCWKWWPRRGNQMDISSPRKPREKPEIIIQHNVQEPQSPSSVGSSSPLTNNQSEELTTPQIEISVNSFYDDVFNELDKSGSKQMDQDPGNYCEFTKTSGHSKNNPKEKQNLNNCNLENEEIVLYVDIEKGDHQLRDNPRSLKGQEIGNASKDKHNSDQSRNLKEKLENFMKCSDDIVLGDKCSVHSLSVDSGYTSRQVSKDNCTTQC